MFDVILLLLTGAVAGAFSLYKWAVWNQKRTTDPEAVKARIDEINQEEPNE